MGCSQSCGCPDVPRIPEDYVDSVVYLYSSAEHGAPVAGSGVLVGVESSKIPGFWHVHVVTNAHLAKRAQVVRYNSRDGLQACEVTADLWANHPEGWDVSVCALPLSVSLDDRVSWISKTSFITRKRMDEIPLRHGDELFMVSCYGGLPGDTDNEPITRLGTLAKRRPVSALSEDGPQESFVGEMRSMPGHSGSPTFVYFHGTQPRLGADAQDVLPTPAIYLLGTDWGHPTEKWPVRRLKDDAQMDVYAVANSGLAYIVPAWRIAEILDGDDLKQERRRAEKALAKERSAPPHTRSTAATPSPV